MKKIICLSLALILLLAAVLACAQPAPTTTPPKATTPAATTPAASPKPTAPTPALPRKPEGTLTWAVPAVDVDVWLLPNMSTPAGAVLNNVNETLLMRPIGTYDKSPGLAEKWEMAPDGKTWTFQLRKGIQFHDNWGEFTSADVKFTFEQIIKEGSLHPQASALRRSLASIDTSDPYTAVLRFKDPDPVITNSLTNSLPSAPIQSKKYYDTAGEKKFSQHPIGTGPWKFVEQKTGEYMKFEAVENHWRQTPYFKTLVYKVVPEEASRVAMLRTGEADLAQLSLGTKPELVKAKVRVVSIPGADDIWLCFGGMLLPTNKSYDPTVPWAQPDKEKALMVRKAMALAIDKQSIVDNLYEGEGELKMIFDNYFIGSGAPWVDPSWKPYPFDPKQAKELLTKAGYPNGFAKPIKMIIQTGTARNQSPLLVQAIAMDWEKNLGLKVEFETMEYATFRPKVHVAREQAWRIWALQYGPKDEPNNESSRHSKGALSNGGPESPEMDALIEKTRMEVDYAKRAELNKQIGQILYDEYASVGLALINGIWGAGPKVGEVPWVKFYTYPHNSEYITHAGQKR